MISLSCVLPLASAASLYDNSLCRRASGPNYFSGLHSANKCHGLYPSRILLLTLSPRRSFSSFVVRRRRVQNYLAQIGHSHMAPTARSVSGAVVVDGWYRSGETGDPIS